MAVLMPRSVMWASDVRSPYVDLRETPLDWTLPFWASAPQAERAVETDVLAILEKVRIGQGADLFGVPQTAAEMEAESLFMLACNARRRTDEAARRGPLLRLTPYRIATDRSPMQPDSDGRRIYRPSRLDMLRHGMDWADQFAGMFLRQVVDPTRIDEITPDDPFVMTTVYVVAPLYEPLAAALIWPIVDEFVRRFGDRTAVRVVGMFSTGSFATDDTFTVEEASTHAALSELEILCGHATHERAAVEAVRDVVAERHPEWARRVAPDRSLFDSIYLVDRTKTSRSIARDSHELAVLVSNAIEGFLAAEIEDELDTLIDRTTTRTGYAYRLVGSVSDYVPLDDYLAIAHRDEVNERVRRDIFDDVKVRTLQSPAGGVLAADRDGDAMIRQLKVQPHQVIAQLGEAKITRRLFDRPRSRLHAQWRRFFARMRTRLNGRNPGYEWGAGPIVPELQLSREFLRPPAEMRRLGRISGNHRTREWLESARAVSARLMERIGGSIGGEEFDRAWGLAHLRFDGPNALEKAKRVLQQLQLFTWTRRRKDDEALVPQTLFVLMQSIVELIAADPAGLRVAVHRLEKLREGLFQLGGTPTSDVLRSQREKAEKLADDDQTLSEVHLSKLLLSMPHASAIMVRSLTFALVVMYGAGYMLSVDLPARGIIFSDWLQIGSAAAVGVVAVLPGIVWYSFIRYRHFLFKRRARHILDQRVNVVADLTAGQRIFDVHSRLSNAVTTLHNGLRESLELIDERSARRKPAPPFAPMSEFRDTCHLRRAATAPEVWERVRAVVAAEAARAGVDGGRLWIEAAKDMRNWMDLGTRLAQRIRLSVEYPVNAIDALDGLAAKVLVDLDGSVDDEVVSLQARQHRSDQRALGTWCPFREEGTGRNLKCTACSDSVHCPFGGEGLLRHAESNVGALLYATYFDAMPNLLDRIHGRSPEQRAILAQLIAGLSVENLLLESQAHGTEYPAELLDQMLHHSKVAAGFDFGIDVGHERTIVSFLIVQDANSSRLRDAALRVRMRICSSEDPSSVTALTVVAGLARADLNSATRAASEYARLSANDLDEIAIVSSTDRSSVYVTDDTDVVRMRRNIIGTPNNGGSS